MNILEHKTESSLIKMFYLYPAQMLKKTIKVVKIGKLDSFKPCNFQLRNYFYDLIDSLLDRIT